MTVSFSRVATEDALIWPAALAVNEPRPTEHRRPDLADKVFRRRNIGFEWQQFQ